MSKAVKHPAKYSEPLIPQMAKWLKGYEDVLDPFAGVGKITEIWQHGYEGSIFCHELEPEWAEQIDPAAITLVGDSRQLPFADESFAAICTSPTYGNRMADSHNAKDDSKRNTYTHTLGRKLSDGNSGAMQFGEKYKLLHIEVWGECWRVLKPGGIFILNISNHIRKGQEVDVTGWHMNMLRIMGFKMIEHKKIKTRRLGQGQNGQLRVEYESLILFKKEEE